MAHGQNLAIFRGRLKFSSNIRKIWGVLVFLSVVTIIEVILGILRPEFLDRKLFAMKLLNWIFIALTVVKAYYITWDFMHIRDETKSMKLSVVFPLALLIPYLTFIMLTEADYLFEVIHGGLLSWNF